MQPPPMPAHGNGFANTAGLPFPDGPPASVDNMAAVPVIEIKGLVKRYGATEAVRGIDLEIEAGECFALLGPNGAGKTTTVEILEGYRERTKGEVSVLGFDPQTGGRA